MTFTACEKDAADLFATEPVAPVMDAHADVLLTENSQTENISFTWKAARNLEGDVLYTLYATSEAQQIQLTKTTNLYYTASKETLRMQLVEGLNAEPNSNFSVKLFVLADNGVYELISEAITINVFAWGDYVPAVVSLSSAAQQGIVLSEDQTENVELISWEAARFEYGTSPRYKVEIQYGDGARATLADGIADTKFSIAPATLNAQLIALGCTKEAENEVKLIVTSTLEGEGAPVLESAAVSFTVKPYTPSYPEFVMLCGDFGGHNWSPTSNLPILKGDANTGVYHGLVSYYGATWGMKVIYTHPKSQETVWVGGTSEDGVNYAIGSTVGDNVAPEEGSYVVYVDLAKGTMTLGKIESIGLIGSATELGWDGQTNFTYNAETGAMELKGMTLGEGAYKIRVNDNWGNPWEDPKAYNMGGSPDALVFGGADIASEPGVYDVTLNLSTSDNNKLSFVKTGDVVIEDPMTKNYGLVGTINEWGGTPDIAMTLVEGEECVVAKAVEMPADNQFKVRVDSDWAENYGAAGDTEPAAVTVGQKISLVAGGKNMTVAAGSYDIYYFPKSKEFLVLAAGAELPKSSYGLVGTINSWGGTPDPEFVAVEGSVYSVVKNVTVTADDQFKVRFANAWDENYGGAGDVEPFALTAGTATTLVANGKNMSIAAGAYDFYFNVETKEFLALATGSAVPTPKDVYSMAGSFNSWGDTDMTDEDSDGMYELMGVTLEANAEFKFKKNHSWADPDCFGGDGTAVTIGAAITLVQPGSNIVVATAGKYDVYLNPAELKAYVMPEGQKPGSNVEPTPTPTPGAALVWDSPVWEQFYTTYGGDNVEQDVDLGNGLKFIAGGSKCKFGGSAGAYRIQLGGTGNATKCTLQLTVTGSGTLEVDMQSSNTSTDRFLAVSIDQTEVTPADGLLAPMGERKVHTVDCSAAKAGSVINMYSKNSGINVFVVKWTPAGASTPTPDPVALATPVVTLDPASVEAGQEKAVAVAWATVENAASYDVVFNGAAAVNVATNAYTIDAATVKALVKGEYKVSVVAKPAADATAYLASAAGEATLTVTAPAAVPLEWGDAVFKNFFETLSGGDKNTEIKEDVDFGNGLKFIAGGGKCKFGVDGGMHRMQYGGSGSFEKQTMALTVTGPGTLELKIRSSNSSEERYLGVWVDQVANYTDPGLKGPVSGEEPVVHTIDCSTAKAGSVINFHCLGSGINLYDVKWTPKQ